MPEARKADCGGTVHRVRQGKGHRSTRRYLAILFATLSSWSLAVMLTMLVDPLWYFAGNQLGSHNYAFNERLSKANIFQSSVAQIDCLILGSSRATLLDAKLVGHRNCFNYAVSQALLVDDLMIANYVRSQGVDLQTLIVGLDGFVFSDANPAPVVRMPDFYRSGDSPPPAFPSYASVDAFGFSWRTLLGESPNGRYYDRTFKAHLLLGEPYDAGAVGWATKKPKPDATFNQFSLGPFSGRGELARLAASFPAAERWAYVPPVTADYTAQLALAGTLDSYLEVLHAARVHFQVLLDFSVPSVITRERTHTSDGSHYSKSINDEIARALNRAGAGRAKTGASAHALSLTDLSLDEYKKRFHGAVNRHLAERKLAPTRSH